MKQKIIDGAESLFLRFGIRSVSMDDVARDISVSKKTLYQYFTNKDELVNEVTKHHFDENIKNIELVIGDAKDAIDELFLLSRCMRENISRINPSLMYDLQKYHSSAWNLFHEFKGKFMRGKVLDNIKRGKSEGLYRNEIDENIISIMRIEQVQMILDERIFPKSDYDFVQVQLQVYDHFINGLFSEKGKKHYQKYQSKILTNIKTNERN